MTSWAEMNPIEFDAARAPTAKARKFAASAPETLFPRLMPEPKSKSAPTLPDELPGQEPLFPA